MRFIKDYHRLNQKLVRNPYTLPRIGKTMQQLEEIQYVTALDINMGYYTIRILSAIQDMMTNPIQLPPCGHVRFRRYIIIQSGKATK